MTYVRGGFGQMSRELRNAALWWTGRLIRGPDGRNRRSAEKAGGDGGE